MKDTETECPVPGHAPARTAESGARSETCLSSAQASLAANLTEAPKSRADYVYI